MNLNLKNTLRLERRIRIEGNGQQEEKRPERLPPVQTTPKRTKIPQGQSQKAQPQEYRSSPILFTQDTNNEVAWDWQSPETQRKHKRFPEASSTPKRTKTVQKKRNSNSPLVYKPFKKRIIKHEDNANMDEWKREFLALDAQIETATSNEASTENVESHDISDEIIFDDDDFDEEDHYDVTIVPNSSKKPPEEPSPVVTSTTDVHIVDSKEKASLEDLFNDSLNDESMLRCSQEIEDKLKISPVKPVAPSEVKKYGGLSVPKILQKPTVSIPSPTSRFKKYKSEPIDKNSSINQRTSTKEVKSSDFIDLDDFDLPDDSFDEIVKKVLSQAPKYDDNPTGPSTSRLDTKSNDSSTNNAKNGTTRGQVVDNNQRKPYFKPKLPVKATPASSQRTAVSQRGNLGGNLGSTSSSLTPMNSGSERRFFKSKNRSDSSFDSSSRSSYCSGARGGKTSSSSVSTQMMDLRRTQSSTDQRNNVMSRDNKNSTNCINNFNRLRVSEGGSSSSSVSRSQTLCTPEEIEKKRIEAKTKLEAKRRMQETRNPVKR